MTSNRSFPGTQPTSPWPRLWTAALVFGLTLLLVAVPLAAQTNPPGLAPLAGLASAGAALGAVQERGGPRVDPTNRSEAANFYNEYYVIPDDLNLEWSGNYTDCSAGSTGQRFREAILRRINYFRAMAGVPADVTFSDDYNRKAQAAALMMSANRRLSHSPTQDWQCYSQDGADGAGNSNLYLQVLSPDAIDGYMDDPGDHNIVVLRRWLLFPQTMQMGTGDVPALGDNPAANALWVIDTAHYFDARPQTRDGYVAWPPRGFVPEHLIFDRWSISYADADFGNAQVTMTLNGQPVGVNVVSDGPGYGEATIAWEPNLGEAASSFSAAGGDNSFHVSVSNVRVDGAVRTFDYEITTFQPGPPAAATLTTRLFAPYVTR